MWESYFHIVLTVGWSICDTALGNSRLYLFMHTQYMYILYIYYTHTHAHTHRAFFLVMDHFPRENSSNLVPVEVWTLLLGFWVIWDNYLTFSGATYSNLCLSCTYWFWVKGIPGSNSANSKPIPRMGKGISNGFLEGFRESNCFFYKLLILFICLVPHITLLTEASGVSISWDFWGSIAKSSLLLTCILSQLKF